MEGFRLKVVLATPTLDRPFPAYLESLERSVPALDAAGIEHSTVYEVGCPYISAARATMLRKAMDARADAVVFIDHDMSWRPEDLVKLIKTDAEVCAGTYRFKTDAVEYMGTIKVNDDNRPLVREDGCLEADKVPAGFLKVTAHAVDYLMRAYPELVYGPAFSPCIDLFQHGAHKGTWWGEDYAFSRRWIEADQKLWLVPDLDLTHWDKSGKDYPGNFHEYLLRRPGGSKHDDSADHR